MCVCVGVCVCVCVCTHVISTLLCTCMCCRCSCCVLASSGLTTSRSCSISTTAAAANSITTNHITPASSSSLSHSASTSAAAYNSHYIQRSRLLTRQPLILGTCYLCMRCKLCKWSTYLRQAHIRRGQYNNKPAMSCLLTRAVLYNINYQTQELHTIKLHVSSTQ